MSISSVMAQEANGEKGLGQEIDLVGSDRSNDAVKSELGVCAFVPGTIMRQNFGHPVVGYWGYLTTMVTF